jgi:transcriptional regulator with XRE-family HTH domain
MGQTARKKPSRLGEKLLRVRTALGLSQNGMIKKLGLAEEISQSNISGFERGVREPSLLVLLKYARVAGVSMDLLVDDDVDLPKHLPNLPEHSARIIKPGKTKRHRQV